MRSSRTLVQGTFLDKQMKILVGVSVNYITQLGGIEEGLSFLEAKLWLRVPHLNYYFNGPLTARP